MPRQSPTLAQALENPCAIIRSLGVLSDSWSFLLVREALLGARTFAQFRDALGIASDVLSARLAALVEHGVLQRTPYREPGQRTREAYDLTPAGEELTTVMVAMQQWGDRHVPRGRELRVLPLTIDGQQRVHAQLIDADGRPVAPEQVRFVRLSPPDDTRSDGAHAHAHDTQPADAPSDDPRTGADGPRFNAVHAGDVQSHDTRGCTETADPDAVPAHADDAQSDGPRICTGIDDTHADEE